MSAGEAGAATVGELCCSNTGVNVQAFLQARRRVVLLTLPCTDCAASIVLDDIYRLVEQRVPATDDDLVREIRFRTLAICPPQCALCPSNEQQIV